jgi:chaperone modulatory protein CbpM
MQNQLITVEAYCTYHHAEPEFIEALERGGLLSITIMDNNRFINYEQLQQLESYTRWYYDMDINVPGIDAIINLLDKVKQMQQEIETLKQQLAVYQVQGSSL